MIDPVAAILALFGSDTGDNGLVQEVQGATRVRIYGAPPGLGKEAINPATGIPYKSLVVQQAGGNVARNVPIIVPMFYIIGYGQDAREATRVVRKVYNVLYDANGRVKCNRMISNRWFLYWAEIEALSAPVTEQESNWPVAYATVRAKFSATQGA